MIEIMQRPKHWPRFPFLPLKRENEDGIAVGVLAQVGTQVQPVVYLRDWTDKSPLDLGEPKKHYDTFGSLYDDGWRVD